MGITSRSRTSTSRAQPEPEAALLGRCSQHVVLQVQAKDPGEEDQDRGSFSGQVQGDRPIFEFARFRQRLSLQGRISNEPHREVRSVVISASR